MSVGGSGLRVLVAVRESRDGGVDFCSASIIVDDLEIELVPNQYLSIEDVLRLGAMADNDNNLTVEVIR